MVILKKWIIFLGLAFALQSVVAGCNKRDDEVVQDDKTQPVYGEVLKAISLINQLEENIQLGIFLDAARSNEKDQFMMLITEIKVALFRLKQDQSDQSAQANLIQAVRMLEEKHKIIDTDAPQYYALKGQLDVVAGLFQLPGSGGALAGGELYSSEFSKGFGDFGQFQVSGSAKWELKSFNENTYLAVSAFTSKKAAETWLLSPVFDFSEVSTPSLQIRQAIGFLNDWSSLTVLVSNNYTSGNPNEAEWETIEVEKKPDVSSRWEYETSEKIDLSGLVSNQTVIAFRYEATDASQPTWQIASFSLSGQTANEFNVTPLGLANEGGNPGSSSGNSGDNGVSGPLGVRASLVTDANVLFHDWFNREEDKMLNGYLTLSESGKNEWRAGSFQAGENLQTYLGMSGFRDDEDNVDWLISPEIDLTSAGEPFLQLVETINFIGDWSDLVIRISSDFSGDISSATWSDNILKRNDELPSSWTDYQSNALSLEDYKGKKIRVGFQYFSKGDSDKKATWRIQEILVADGAASNTPPDEEPEPVPADLEAELTSAAPIFHDWFNRERDNMSDGYTITSLSGNKSWRAGSFYNESAAQLTTYIGMSGFKEADEAASDDWLVSPQIDLTTVSSARLSLIETFAFFTQWTDLEVMVSKDFSGDVSSATWQSVEIARGEARGKWERLTTSDISLESFVGSKIVIAFHYKSTAEAASTWQINEILVTE